MYVTVFGEAFQPSLTQDEENMKNKLRTKADIYAHRKREIKTALKYNDGYI